MVLGLGIAEGWLGTWVDPELLAVSGSDKSLASDKEFTKSWIWVNNCLTVIGFLSWCRDNSSILACLARSASSQQDLLNSSISWPSFAWCFRKSLFLISNSPYKLTLSRGAWSAHWFACCTVIDATRTPVWLHKEQYPNFSFPNVWPPRLLQLCIIFAEPHGKFSLDVFMFAQRFWSRSLFPFDTDSKRLETTVSRSMCAEVSLMQVRSTTESRWANLREACP